MPRIAVGVGGSDHNTGLSALSDTRPPARLIGCDSTHDALLTRPCTSGRACSGLQNRGHALAAGRTDRDQGTHGFACGVALRFLLRELLGRLGEDPPAG